MTALKNKIDFALIFSVRNANPNGDPLDGNRPRTTLDGKGEVSDVCLKRKIRNRLMDEGEDIFVQSDDRRNDRYRSLKDRADSVPELLELRKKKKNEEFAIAACKKWYDVRAFGQVFAIKSDKKSKGDDEDAGSDALSIGVRGPVSIQSAYSVEPVSITDMQIVKSVNLETQSDPNRKARDTMGSKHRVDYGVYVTFGAINVQCAQKTGFSDADAQKLKRALLTLFRNDATSARPGGSMEVLKLVWWEHNSPNGQYSSARVHRLVEVSNDGSVVVKSLEGLSCEVLDGE
ncbi:MAG: type I-C CRISPR-associated protein Cas7/Csd2 [Clostridia bacterium]|nr:type I-C CRISPR-associated protein Cas7/Csd2 [Clostridia bacterium]